ncbi:MAG: hypothetical protein SOX04_00765 [Eubacteriales bacterium]|nr:hypothetical protein [Christensenellaceae bacterium]MDY3241070.1 hypothetical protein [Eubacteriales bacterium]
MNKIIKAEMWDKMQYLFRNYYDRMVHAVLHFDNLIDPGILKNVIVIMAEKAPVLHSSFHENPVNPYWSVEKYTVDDILTVADSDDPYKDSYDFLCQSIPVTSNVQFKILLLNKDGRSTLAMIVNHMCFDGGDFKYFLKKLAKNYNAMLSGENPTDLKSGTRSAEQVYTKLNASDKKIAKGLYKNISDVKDKHVFPLTPASDDDRTMINVRKIERPVFTEMKNTGKRLGVTVNDVMLAAYVRALYEIIGMRDDETLSIPCMVDLRRHIEGGENAGGLANHTGFMLCTVHGKGETINDTLINVMRSTKSSKRDKFMGLYSLPLLKLAYTILPFSISEFAIKIGYNNPLIGMSNIGLLPEELLTFGNAKPVDGFMTGAVKYKPFMQLAMTTLNDELTMTIAIKGNEADKEKVEVFFDLIERNIEDFINTPAK